MTLRHLKYRFCHFFRKLIKTYTPYVLINFRNYFHVCMAKTNTNKSVFKKFAYESIYARQKKKRTT